MITPPPEKALTAESLKAAIREIAPSKKRQAIDLLRQILSEIEQAIAGGKSRKAIVAALKAKGLSVTQTDLKALLDEKKAADSGSAVEPADDASGGAE